MQRSRVEVQDLVCRTGPCLVRDGRKTTLQCNERAIGKEEVVGCNEREAMDLMRLQGKDMMGRFVAPLRNAEGEWLGEAGG